MYQARRGSALGVKLKRLKFDATGIDLRQIESVVDDAEQMIGGGDDALRIFRRLRAQVRHPL